MSVHMCVGYVNMRLHVSIGMFVAMFIACQHLPARDWRHVVQRVPSRECKHVFGHVHSVPTCDGA